VNDSKGIENTKTNEKWAVTNIFQMDKGTACLRVPHVCHLGG